MSPRPKAVTPRVAVANIRLTEAERSDMETEAKALGFGTISEYVRHLHNKQVEIRKAGKPPRKPRWPKPKRFANPSSSGCSTTATRVG